MPTMPSLTRPFLIQRFGVLIGAVLLYAASQLLAGSLHLTVWFAPTMAHRYVWVQYYEHHLWQLAFALVCIGIFSKGRYSRWGFNLGHFKMSVRWSFVFCIVTGFVALGFIPAELAWDANPGVIHPLTPSNLFGWLGFEWLIVGISEEVLFRGLLQNFLEIGFPGAWNLRCVAIPHAGFLSTIIFCLAHVSYDGHPHIPLDQLTIVFCLGLYTSTLYARTRSLAAPIFAHNFQDGLFVSVQTLCYYLRH